MIYKTLKKVSDYCQLVDKSTYPATQTVSGVTFTNNGDGSWTLNGTSTSQIYWDIINVWIQLNTSHKYLLLGCPKNESNDLFLYVNNGGALFDFDSGNGSIGTPTKNRGVITVAISNNISVNNAIFKPQLFDLTEMYGAGNEPTTVEQFRQDFPDEMYDYKPYCFVKSYKTLLKASNVCQLLDKSQYPATQTVNGVTFTNNGDGTITANGTATERAVLVLFNKTLPIIRGTGLIIGDPQPVYAFINYMFYNNKNEWLVDNASYRGNGVIFTGKDDAAYAMLYIAIEPGSTANNLIFKPQLFDLTEMYGAGNEPTTVEQFREKFPNELYDYKPYSIITSYKKSFKVTNSILL